MVAGEFSAFTMGSSFRMGGSPDSSPSGVKSFMNGVMSPFTACWQPDPASCVPGCAPDYHRAAGRRPRTSPTSSNTASSKGPAVVSPLMDRMANRYAQGPEHHRSPISSPPRYPSSSEAHSHNHQKPEKLPSSDIEKPHSNDVLCGRGGSSNRHLGNMHFRELVAVNKKMYVGLTKKQKMMVARRIVEMVHTTSPPGRFLAKDLDTGLWYDIGLPRSLEKTSQALREKNSNDYPLVMVEGSEGQGTEATISDVLSDTSMPSSPRSDSGAASPVNGSSNGSVKSTAKSTSSARSSKNVEAPPLTIPSQLSHIFGPKKHPSPQHAWSPEHGHAPRFPPPHHLDQPYLHSYPPASPGGPRDERYPLPPPRSRPYEVASPRSPPHYPHHAPPPHLRHPPHPYESGAERHPPYRPSYGGQESPARLDYREQQHEYYSRRPDPRDPYAPPPHHRHHPYAPPHHYRAYPPPPPPPGPPPSRSHHRRVPPGHHHHPHPSQQRPKYYPSSPAGPAAMTPPMSPISTSSSIGAATDVVVINEQEPRHSQQEAVPIGDIEVVKSSSVGGYVRSKAEVSPDRRQEYKRLRKESGGAHRLTSNSARTVQRQNSSEASLSRAVENSLTLEERVVGRERHSQQTTTTSGEGPFVLQSPSGVLQGRSHPRSRSPPTASSSLEDQETEAATALSGLAALSTAAFLKLDETN